MSFVHGCVAPDARPVVSLHGWRPLEGSRSLEKVARELHFDRYQCSTLLRAGEYQWLQVDAPNVPQGELKSAIRWRLKDMLDYHVDDAAFDVLEIPRDGADAGRGYSLFAVAARNEVIQQSIRRFEDARVALSVIEVLETAQRNVAALYETEGRGVALVYFDPDWGLLTVNYRAELFLARRLEIGLKHLRAGAAGDEARERLALELQRTFDHFERQFSGVAIVKLLLGPAPEDLGLSAVLSERLGMGVETIDLTGVLAFDGEAPAPEEQWRLFHLVGAALRHEAKAL